MRLLLLTLSATALVATACTTRPGESTDPFTVGDTSLPFTMECVAKDANGGCLKFTCKQNAESDCAGFANGCVRGGNHYAGTSEGGACSKVL